MLHNHGPQCLPGAHITIPYPVQSLSFSVRSSRLIYMHCSLFQVSLIEYIDSLLCDGRDFVIFASKGSPILETDCDGDTKTHCFGPKTFTNSHA
jgi:hypothetical protein